MCCRQCVSVEWLCVFCGRTESQQRPQESCRFFANLEPCCQTTQLSCFPDSLHCPKVSSNMIYQPPSPSKTTPLRNRWPTFGPSVSTTRGGSGGRFRSLVAVLETIRRAGLDLVAASLCGPRCTCRCQEFVSAAIQWLLRVESFLRKGMLTTLFQ